jgi:hypothetical protein
LIPANMVKTRLDEKINEAYSSARKEGGRRYVFQMAGVDNLVWTREYPKAQWTEGWVVIVDPVGFAVVSDPEKGEVI